MIIRPYYGGGKTKNGGTNNQFSGVRVGVTMNSGLDKRTKNAQERATVERGLGIIYGDVSWNPRNG